MWASMTGYGRAELQNEEVQIGVELRATNHRYQEIVLRSPRELAALEDRMRKLLQGLFLRGRLEVSLNLRYLGAGLYTVQVKPELALAYRQGLSRLAEMTGLSDTVSLSEIAALPEVLRVERGEIDLEALWLLLEEVLKRAFSAFQAMRVQEGQRLHEDLSQRLQRIEKFCGEVEQRSPQLELEYQQRLQQRLEELLEHSEIDQPRLVQEVASWVERTTITEELVRLNSHCAQFAELLATSGEAVGRRADFLLQEMNREVNTIGSKANDLQIGQLVIEMKSELEKIREQVQNIE